MGEGGEVGSAANSLVFLKKKYEIWRKRKDTREEARGRLI